ncbi:GNAT family protein [Thioclava sp. GXIMD2076]|uniref:GNAT family N-acetyltransferase n=1 Tax=Thioclava sp. GXIMD2076 TaxID=3131931 RepID=UPI0030D2B5BE
MTSPAVALRRPLLCDISARATLGISEEISRMAGAPVRSRAELTAGEAKAWFHRLQLQPHGQVILLGGELVGEIRFDTLNPHDRRGRMAMELYHPRHMGRGIGRQALRLFLDHAFGTQGLHRIDLRVLLFNTRAIRCYEACGFRYEGTERESALIDGQWHDDHIMALLEQEYRAHAADRKT